MKDLIHLLVGAGLGALSATVAILVGVAYITRQRRKNYGTFRFPRE